MKIKTSDVIQSVNLALQYISYYHSPDFIIAMNEAYEKEDNLSAKNAIAQILVNSKMAAISQRPICQDTGIVTVFVEVGMSVQWQGDLSLDEMINQGVAQAYCTLENPLRASIVSDPLFLRTNTKNNTPAVIHTSLVKGNSVNFFIAAKGAGSENKARFTTLNPGENLLDWVLKTIPTLGAGWCPPGMLGIGVGGTAEKAMLMAKRSLLDEIDINTLQEKTNLSPIEELRLEIYEKVNDLGIGAQGLGGLTTVLDVKIQDYPTHAASLPIAMIPNCAATRHIHFCLDGSGVAQLPEVDINSYPKLEIDYSSYRRIDLNNLTNIDLTHWKIGETLLLSGTILTGRDAAHRRLAQLIEEGKPLPEGVDFDNKFIYYVGPVDPVGDEVLGPAGPTTSTRMDKYTEMMLTNTNILGMIGKAERGAQTVGLLAKHKCVYLIAVGGAAYLISKSIKQAKKIAFKEMGMEAIYQLEVKDMPVTVAVDIRGNNIHQAITEVHNNLQ